MVILFVPLSGPILYRRAYVFFGETGVRGLTADERLGDPPPRCIQEPSVGRDVGERPQEGPLTVHCFYVCSGSALLGDRLVVSRSVEYDSVCPVLSSVFRVYLSYRLSFIRVGRCLLGLVFTALTAQIGYSLYSLFVLKVP